MAGIYASGFPLGVTLLSSDNDDNIFLADGYDIIARKQKSETVLVNSVISPSYYVPNTLLYADTPYYYTYPTYKNISYLDVNADKDLQKKVVKKFYSALYNNWVPDLHPKLLNYVKLTKDEAKLVKSEGDAKSNSTKEDEYGDKINYLADYIFTKTDIYEELYNYIEKRGLNWWELSSRSDELELLLIKKLEQKIKDIMME